MNNVYDCSEMILKTFANIEQDTFKKNDLTFETWKKVVCSIRNNGQNIFEHSSIVEIKNKTLLVEADHSGWLQLLQLNTRYIVRGFEMYAPQLGIKNLAFRLKGSNALLHEVNYDELMKKEQLKNQQKMEEQEKQLSKFQNFAPKVEKNELPEELLKKFESMKKKCVDQSQK